MVFAKVIRFVIATMDGQAQLAKLFVILALADCHAVVMELATILILPAHATRGSPEQRVMSVFLVGRASIAILTSAPIAFRKLQLYRGTKVHVAVINRIKQQGFVTQPQHFWGTMISLVPTLASFRHLRQIHVIANAAVHSRIGFSSRH